MFSIFGRRDKQQGPATTEQTEQPRGIHGERRRGFFVFQDDRGKERILDPFLIFRQLTHDPKVDLEKHCTAADNGEEPETTELIDLVCRVFHVTRYDPETQSGMTDWEIIDLLTQYQVYLENLKKTTGIGLTSSEPTDLKSSQKPQEHPQQPTENLSSSSTANVNGSFVGEHGDSGRSSIPPSPATPQST